MIAKTNAYYMKLEGSNYEVGEKLGHMVESIPGLIELCKTPQGKFSKDEMNEIFKLFNEFCPGINEEITGFSDVLKIPVEQVMYYAFTYLKPGCSQLVALPSITKDKHILVARNYDMSDKDEELKICATKIKNRYAHIGSSMVLFGRGDGMNEEGLVVSMSSVGIPVGATPPFRKPMIKGLQFWAVIRSLLEQCKTVEEAVALAKEMPISFNINLILADKGGNAALVETLDGHKEIKGINADSKEQFLCVTNHAVLPEIQRYEPQKMRNSVVRYDLMNKFLSKASNIEKQDLKDILSRKYPEGLNCNYYDDYFGTLRGMIFDPIKGTIDIRFGSSNLNDWHSFSFNDILDSKVYDVKLDKERCSSDFFEFI